MCHFKPLFRIIVLCLFVLPTILFAQDELIVISPSPEGVKIEFIRNFEKWYEEQTGRIVKIDWRNVGGTSANYRFVESEFKRVPDSIGIDVFFGGGTDICVRLAEKGFLSSYKLPDVQLEQIPQSFHGVPLYDTEHQWYGTALSSFGIMCNEEIRLLLQLPEIKAWKDLGDLMLEGKVGAADPRASGSSHVIYEIIIQNYGWKEGFALLTKIGGNVRGFASGSSVVPREVAAGDVIYGLVIDFYAYGQITIIGADTIKYIMPIDGTVLHPDSIAILKGAPNMVVAEKFLEFVLSERAQKLWMLRDTDPEGPKWKGGLNRASILPALYNKLGQRCVVMNPFTLKPTRFEYNSDKSSIRWDLVNDLIGTLIIDSHKELVKAWKTIRKCENAEKRAKAIKVLSQIPISEEEAMKLARNDWQKPAFRNKKIKEWGEFARWKFREARKLVE